MEDASSGPHPGSWGSLRHLENERGQGGQRAGRERALPASAGSPGGTAGARVTLVCAPAALGERWPGYPPEGPDSRAGVPPRELQALGPEPPPPLCRGCLFPGESSEFAQCPSPQLAPQSQGVPPPRGRCHCAPGPSRPFRGPLASLH